MNMIINQLDLELFINVLLFAQLLILIEVFQLKKLTQLEIIQTILNNKNNKELDNNKFHGEKELKVCYI